MFKQVILLLFPLYCFGQISGTVKDNNNQPLEGVDVIVTSTSVTTQTDSQGIFTLNYDIPSNTLLYFSKEMYESQSLIYNNDKDISITLEKRYIDIDEVVVSSINQKLSNSQTTNIQSKKMNQLNASTFDLVESLSQISGVSESSTGNGIKKIVVRGLSGMRVVTLMNGIRVENQQWGGDHGIGFTDLGVGKVELVKGPASIMFGADALGGALYFSDENYLDQKKIQANLTSTFESSSMRFNNKLGVKWAYKRLKSNTHIEYGNAADYKMPNNRYLFNSRYSNTALKTSMGYNMRNWVMNLRYQYNYNILGVPAHSHDKEPTLQQLSSSTQNRYPTRPTQFNAQHLINLENKFYFGTKTLKATLSNSTNHLEEFEAWTVPEIDMILGSNQLNLDYSMPISQMLKWSLGTQAAFLNNKNREARTQLLPDATTNDIGAYTLLELTKNSFTAQAGFRYDNRSVELMDNSFSKEFNAYSATLGISKKVENQHIRLSYSSAFRTPHFSELLANGVHHGTQRHEIGETDLVSEVGNQIDLSYEWNNKHLGVIINPYYHIINDFIALNPKDSTINNYPVYKYEQEDNVTIKGLEMNLHYHPHFAHQLHIEETITLLEGKNENNYLALMPANKFQTAVKYYFDESKNKIQLHHAFIDYTYHSAQNKVAENESVSEEYGLINLGTNITFNNRPDFELILGVKNITNKSYISHLSRLKSYGIPHEGRSYFIKLSSTI